MIEDSSEQPPLIINAGYEAFVVAVILLSVVNSILYLVLTSVQQRGVVIIVDVGISVFLLADAFLRLYRARHRWSFLTRHFGWLYFAGSLPLPFLRLLRLLPYYVISRRLRRSDYTAMGRVVVQRRAQTTLLFVILGAIVVLEIGGILMLGAEAKSPDANIHTASDALWWGIVTIATVGYGDRYPVTNPGRVIGVMTIVAGVGLFSAVTSFLAQWFLSARSGKDKEIPPNGQPGDQPGQQTSVTVPGGTQSRIDEIKRMIDEHEQARQEELARLRAKLAELEAALHSPEARG